MHKGHKNVAVLTCAKEITVDHAFCDCADLSWLSSHGVDVSLQRRPLFPMSFQTIVVVF